MFKKLFIAFIMITLIAVGSVMACPGGNCPPGEGPLTATGYYYGEAPSNDNSNSYSGYPGAYNDDAHSSARGYAGGDVSTYANAAGQSLQYVGTSWVHICCGIWIPVPRYDLIDNPADQSGGMNATSHSDAWSYTNDHYSRTSRAGAGASFYGEADTWGIASGKCGNREVVQGTVYVGGMVSQYHNAMEEGYPSGSWVGGGNGSMGEFYASDYDYESGRGYVRDINWINGGANVEGHTMVTGDFYGSHRSISARTYTEANTFASHGMQYSIVQGSGGVGGVIARGGTYAGGASNFSFVGGTHGSGNATLNADIGVHNDRSHVSVSGSSHATANGVVGGN